MSFSSVSRRAILFSLPVWARLPFGLQSGQLAGVRIRLRSVSTKVGSKAEEIVVDGDGGVLLRAGGRERRGKVSAAAVERLLELMERDGIAKWDETDKTRSSHFVARSITVEQNDAVRKQVVVYGESFPEFAHAMGAIRMLAAQACPEAADGSFFQRL